MAYSFCLRWNGVLRCAFDARGDGVVAAPNEAVRSLILSTRYRTKLCYGQECDHKQSGLLQTSLAGFAWPSSCKCLLNQNYYYYNTAYVYLVYT